jgi:hypothetical protein
MSSARAAVIAAIKAACPGVGVYSDPPKDMALPAVTLERMIEEPQDLLASEQTDLTMTFTLWSVKRGYREIEGIRDQMRAALHDATLPLASGAVVMARWVRSDITRDADGVTYMGSCLVKLTLEPA